MYEIKEGHYSSGQLLWRRYYSNGVLHREDGPAEEFFRENGSPWYWAWYSRGNVHRIDGPAAAWFDIDGNLGVETYWLNGTHLTKSEHHYITAGMPAASIP